MVGMLLAASLLHPQPLFQGVRAGEAREIAGVKFSWCPPGRFSMGSPTTEPGHRSDEGPVQVTLSKGFWIGRFEVTQGQWARIVGAFPAPFTLGVGNDFPMHTVTYADEERFCRKMTEVAHSSGNLPKTWEIRLPTEAQWEYACRAGNTAATSFGDKLSSRQANFIGKPYNGAEQGPRIEGVVKVGSYPPNAWGIYDMHGNAAEWCRDWYHPKLPGGTDPDLSSQKGRANGDGSFSRVRRGGGWDEDGWSCRSACRLRFEPERRYNHIGFRVVAVMK